MYDKIEDGTDRDGHGTWNVAGADCVASIYHGFIFFGEDWYCVIRLWARSYL